jgi:hypothetical protein
MWPDRSHFAGFEVGNWRRPAPPTPYKAQTKEERPTSMSRDPAPRRGAALWTRCHLLVLVVLLIVCGGMPAPTDAGSEAHPDRIRKALMAHARRARNSTAPMPTVPFRRGHHSAANLTNAMSRFRAALRLAGTSLGASPPRHVTQAAIDSFRLVSAKLRKGNASRTHAGKRKHTATISEGSALALN